MSGKGLISMKRANTLWLRVLRFSVLTALLLVYVCLLERPMSRLEVASDYETTQNSTVPPLDITSEQIVSATDRMILALHRRQKLVHETPNGSNRGDTLDAWANRFGLLPPKKSAEGPYWCAIAMSVAADEAGLPFWTARAWGFVIQAKQFGYKVIPARLVVSGVEQVRRGWLCIRRYPPPVGNHIDIATDDWLGAEGYVIGGNVDNAITPRLVQVEAHNRFSYNYFIEVTVSYAVR